MGQRKSRVPVRTELAHDHAAYADGLGRLDHAQPRILEQRSAQAQSVVRRGDGQPPEYDDWNGVGHVAAKATRSRDHGDRAGSKDVCPAPTVLSEDRPVAQQPALGDAVDGYRNLGMGRASSATVAASDQDSPRWLRKYCRVCASVQ